MAVKSGGTSHWQNHHRDDNACRHLNGALVTLNISDLHAVLAQIKYHHHHHHRAWWRIDGDDAFRLEGHGFESRSSRHVGTMGKYLTYSCL